MKSYAVIGLGRFGKKIAKKLFEYGEEVIAVDNSEDQVNEIADSVTKAVIADARNRETLKSIGIGNCDCAIVALGSDFAASVLITMNLKNLGVAYVICKAHDDTHKEILEKLGADQVIIPEREVADKIARILASPTILETIELSSDYGIIERHTPESWVGKTLRQLDVRAKYGINIIAVREPESISVSPNADYMIGEKSVLVLLGDYGSLGRIETLK